MKKKIKKKKSKFPDMSGDGKVTKKDILIARGVIKKVRRRKRKKSKWLNKSLPISYLDQSQRKDLEDTKRV